MTEGTGVGGRVDKLETSVSNLVADVGGIKVQVEGLGAGQSGIFNEIRALADKHDKSRPSIAAIWVPLGVALSAAALIVGAIAAPYREQLTEQAHTLIQLQIDEAVTRDRQARPAPAGPGK